MYQCIIQDNKALSVKKKDSKKLPQNKTSFVE